MTPLQNLPRNVGDLGKLIVAKGFEKLPEVQKIAKSGHTGHWSHCNSNQDVFAIGHFQAQDTRTVKKCFIFITFKIWKISPKVPRSSLCSSPKKTNSFCSEALAIPGNGNTSANLLSQNIARQLFQEWRTIKHNLRKSISFLFQRRGEDGIQTHDHLICESRLLTTKPPPRLTL